MSIPTAQRQSAFARTASMVQQARENATAAARSTGITVAYGLQMNDETGAMEPGHVVAPWADRPGFLYEVYGTVDAQGTDTPRTDTTPAWRK